MKNYDFEIIDLELVESTNNFASKIAPQAVNFTTVRASFQTHGRGQGKNTWYASRGKNLLISIILKPKDFPAKFQFDISKIVSLAVTNVLEDFGINATIKWPNDIYVDDKKIAGILIENSIRGEFISYAIIGIGLNVNEQQFPAYLPNPVSMKILTGKNFDIKEITKKIVDSIVSFVENYKTAPETICEKYVKKLYKLGNLMEFEDSNGSYKGVITGVDDYGRLLIKRLNGNTSVYSHKEVRFVLNRKSD